VVTRCEVNWYGFGRIDEISTNSRVCSDGGNRCCVIAGYMPFGLHVAYVRNVPVTRTNEGLGLRLANSFISTLEVLCIGVTIRRRGC